MQSMEHNFVLVDALEAHCGQQRCLPGSCASLGSVRVGRMLCPCLDRRTSSRAESVDLTVADVLTCSTGTKIVQWKI